METERSLETITIDDLKELYDGSKERLRQYFFQGRGKKWLRLYNIKEPLAVALCQGSAMHYHDKTTGIKDFDIWFFYPFKKMHLPYRTIWNWDYKNPKFGRHPFVNGYSGRKVDTMVRSIRNSTLADPIKTIHQFLRYENTSSSIKLAEKAVVMLYPESLLGKLVWYKQKYNQVLHPIANKAGPG